MTLLKNTIFITLLLLFSFKLSKCQEASWVGEWAITEATVVTEETPVEGFPTTGTPPYGWSEEITTIQEASWFEETTTIQEASWSEEITTIQEASWFEEITTIQEASWSEETTTTEETPIEEVILVEEEEEKEEGSEGEEEGSEGEEEGQVVEESFGETATAVEETTTTETPYGWSEETITERSSGETENTEDPFEEDQPEEGGIVEEAPLECSQSTEEITVNGYIMTLSPCCVSSKADCDNTYDPVCLNKVSVEDGQWTEQYETVNNVCNACKGNSDYSWYSNGKCPWESGASRPCQRQRRLRN